MNTFCFPKEIVMLWNTEEGETRGFLGSLASMLSLVGEYQASKKNKNKNRWGTLYLFLFKLPGRETRSKHNRIKVIYVSSVCKGF